MPTTLEERLGRGGKGLLDRARRLPRKPFGVPASREEAIQAAKGFFGPQTTAGDLDALTDRLVQKYDVLRGASEGEREQVWNHYRGAIQDSYERYGKTLDGGIRVDKIDRILSCAELTTLIPGVGDAIDITKDIIEGVAVKLPYGAMEYFIRPLRARNGDRTREKVHLGRFLTMAGVEIASFIPRVGAFIDFMDLYRKMAADTLITDAYNRTNPMDRRGYDLGYFLDFAFGDVLGRQRRTLPYERPERAPPVREAVPSLA